MAVDRFGRTWPKQRFPIGKILLPASDLGLASGVQGELFYPDDLPLSLALQVVQTPSGMRIAQADPTGHINNTTSTLDLLAATTTQGAGNTGVIPYNGYSGINVYVEILALNGTPTNIKYFADFSLDGGTTWYQGASVTVTTTGVIMIGFGISASAPGTGNQLLGSATFGGMTIPTVRMEWSFTAGTAPTVQHRMWVARR